MLLGYHGPAWPRAMRMGWQNMTELKQDSTTNALKMFSFILRTGLGLNSFFFGEA